MCKNTRNAAGWFLLQLLLATLLIGCTFEDNIEELRRGKLKSGTPDPSFNFTVTFNKNNYDAGSSEANPQTVTVTSPAVCVDTLPEPPTRTGYTFDGWNARANGGRTAFTAATTVTASITVYAQWTAEITFTSIDAFASWLSEQTENNTESPYVVALKLSDLGGGYHDTGSLSRVLADNWNKYLSLDLSGSTFTTLSLSESSGRDTFYNCSNLTSIILPNTLKTIEDDAFYGCDSLASVTIPASVTSIGNYAFSNCTSLAAINVDAANTAYSSFDGVLYNKDKTTLVTYLAGKGGNSFTIPNSVTSIGLYAFFSCSSLASVTIPSSVTSIGDWAFS
jgi:uncharacterized repeat protein (TIGR02543 family)